MEEASITKHVVLDKPARISHKSQKWQSKLLPWLVALPTLLILLFIYLSTKQLNDFSKDVGNYKTSEIDKLVSNIPDKNSILGENIKNNNFLQYYMTVKMEEQLVNKRYTQGGSLLLARLYAQYLGFITGMILAIVGSVFIIAKIKEAETKFDASVEGKTLSFASTSPGVIFAFLGTILMIITITSHNQIQVTDSPTYLNTGQSVIATPVDSAIDKTDSSMANSHPEDN